MNQEVLESFEKKISELEQIVGISSHILQGERPKKISQELTDIQAKLTKELNISDKTRLEMAVKKCIRKYLCNFSRQL